MAGGSRGGKGGRGTATPATQAVSAAGIVHDIIAYTHDPAAASYGAEAAQALGVDAAQVFKTLVADIDGGRLVVALVPVRSSLHLKSLAAAVGGKSGTMADPPAAERATGYVLGGISPLGQRKRLPMVADRSLADHDLVYVSAGRRGLELALAPADLLGLTGATLAAIAR